MKNLMVLVILILIIAIVAGAIAFNVLNEKYMALESEMISEQGMMEKLYINGIQYERTDIVLYDDDYYIEYNLARQHINDSIELSNSGQRVYIDINKEFIDFKDEALNQYIADNIIDLNIPLIELDGRNYIPMEILSRILLFEYGNVGNDFWIITQDHLTRIVNDSGTKLFINQNLNIKKELLGENLTFFGSRLDDSFFIVNDSQLGYVPANTVVDLNEDSSLYSRFLEDGNVQVTEPFYLVWDQINSESESRNFNNELAEVNADIISPTFLELNINGIIINKSDLDYVKWAHENDLAVWVLISNSFNPGWTREMMENPELVDRFIAQLALYATIYDFDGINLDFENIYLDDQMLLNQFVEKLSDMTQKLELPLSMDVTVPEGSDQWSVVYDRKTLGKSVDYLMVMAYDEFWASSSVSGPVASIPWTIEGMEKTFELVDKDKVVLGIPGYMRVWKEYQNKSESSVLSIKNRDNYMLENEFEVEYLPDLKINYSEKKINGTLYRIWLEDKTSMEERLDLVKENNLPGIGVWRRGFFDEEIETLIGNFFK